MHGSLCSDISKLSGAEQTQARGEGEYTPRQRNQSKHQDFSDVEVDDLQEIIGQHQQQPTMVKKLEDDEEQEEQQPTQEDDVKPGEPTTRQKD
ncbi:hypothetical protein Hamer_G018934 [Homarus americanus]|uniref:Uncharacterized protein n=1 Tax=Homarus americanus TaxID=6706 RepID=A0A8J5N071_HOMAM|nr:hypothetical protein Hamer_G018934 [Homarus americanus]